MYLPRVITIFSTDFESGEGITDFILQYGDLRVDDAVGFVVMDRIEAEIEAGFCHVTHGGTLCDVSGVMLVSSCCHGD